MTRILLVISSLFLVQQISISQCSLSVASQEVSCSGASDGVITLVLANGQAPYTYEIDGITITTSDNPFDYNNLPAGTYTVQVTDDLDCMDITQATVNEPQPMLVIVNVDYSCSTSCINLTISGGTPPYTIEWPTGPSPVTNYCDPLQSGTYTILITDANGCETIESFTINNPAIPVIEIIETAINCDSSILTAEAFDGTLPYIYEWSTGEMSPSIIVNTDGVYIVTVTDQNDCSSTSVFDYIGGINFSTSVQDILCFGENNGQIEGSAFGGTPGYSFSWIGPNGFSSANQNIANLPTGFYSVTITDAESCSGEFGPFEITEPDELSIIGLTSSDVSCFGGFDGAIDITVNGGTGPYTYQWSNGISLEDPTGLNAETYSVTVVDSNGCSAEENVTISEASQLIINVTGSPESCLGDGTATAVVSGGTGSYTYLWNNGEVTQEITNLIAGLYIVTVTDSNGCFMGDTIEILSPIDLSLSSNFAGCDVDDGTATVTVLGGATDPSYLWSDGQTTSTAMDLAPDWYSVTVTDAATSCQVHSNIQVLEDTVCYVRISGYVFVDDADQDCLEDSTSLPIANVMVELNDGQIVFTNSDGFYEFIADADSYTISINYYTNSYDDLCSDPITLDAVVSGNSYPDNNFYLQYGDDSDIRLKVVKPNARPGFYQYVRICLMNVGAVPVTGVLTFVHPEVQDFSSSTPSETTYDLGTRTLTWDYTEIPPGAVWIYTIKMYTPIGTALGTPLEYFFKADPIAGDLNPNDNEISCTEVVTGSYDPNDKAVVPEGQGPDGNISMQDSTLNYRIRFQNTGTDTAFSVRLLDTLDSDLNIRSISMGASSHDYEARFIGANVLEILFENILLPDSFVNEPASNGFVIFDIKIKPGFDYGTIIENTAGIYFDFNEPVITNTVRNTIQMVVSAKERFENNIPLELFPNPMQTESELSYSLSDRELLSIAMYDILGNQVNEIISSEWQSEGDHKVGIRKLEIAPGVYFVKLNTAEGRHGSLKVFVK